MSKNKPLFYETYSKDLLEYNARDCAYTARIYEHLINEPRWQETYVQELHRIHVQMSIWCAEMHTEGLYVDRQTQAFMAWFLDTKYDMKERKFLRLVDVPGMRCNYEDLRSLIYARHATTKISRFNLPDPFDPKMYTDESLETISVDSASLKLLIAEGEVPDDLKRIIQAFWDAESAWKQRTFIVSKKTERAIGPDGYLRPGWNSCGTDTMRLSCRDPNVMQWDKEILQMFGVEKGETYVGLDKSQLELRVMEIVSCDDYLWKLIQTGDVYGADVREALGLHPKTPIKVDDYKTAPEKYRRLADKVKGPKPGESGITYLEKTRYQFKINRLSCQYMARLATVYSQWLEAIPDVEFHVVKMHFDRFHRTHADGLVRYAAEETALVGERGYSESRLLGGRRYYPAPPPDTEACNWPIQRTAGEMMNVETLKFRSRLRKYVPNAKVVFQKHDAIATRCRTKDAGTVERIMSDTFNTEYTINGRTRPFPVKIKRGPTLGDV